MAWSALVDMEMSDDEKLDTIMPMPMDRPDYPCGLRISLTEKDLGKLGLNQDCDIGDMVDIRAFAIVTSMNKYDGPDGACCRVELQIQKMAVENEMTEEMGGDDEADDPPQRRARLYG